MAFLLHKLDFRCVVLFCFLHFETQEVELYVVACETVFQMKGLTKKLRTLKQSAAAAITRVKETAVKFKWDIPSDVGHAEISDRLCSALKHAEQTMSETKVMHNIMRDLRTAVSVRQSHVDAELSRLQDSDSKAGQTSLTMHRAIKTKGHEFCRN